jgi:hypothetical protein
MHYANTMQIDQVISTCSYQTALFFQALTLLIIFPQVELEKWTMENGMDEARN